MKHSAFLYRAAPGFAGALAGAVLAFIVYEAALIRHVPPIITDDKTSVPMQYPPRPTLAGSP